jgi:hypothetical protein
VDIQRVKIAYFLLREKAVPKIAFALEQHYQYIIIQKKQGLLNTVHYCVIVDSQFLCSFGAYK